MPVIPFHRRAQANLVCSRGLEGSDEESFYAWIMTASGKRFYPYRFHGRPFDVQDMAAQLAKICRWGGAGWEFYSVAQHSVLASENVSEDCALEALLHDGPEAYIGNKVSPLKAQWPDYTRLEDSLMAQLSDKWNLQWPLPEQVVKIDVALLTTEADFLMPGGSAALDLAAPPVPDLIIDPLSWEASESAFLRRWHEIEESGWGPEGAKRLALAKEEVV